MMSMLQDLLCSNSQIQQFQTQLAAITTMTMASSFTEEHSPFEEVDLTNVEGDDNEAEQDAEAHEDKKEEMHSNDTKETAA
jgi:hypothetical protein